MNRRYFDPEHLRIAAEVRTKAWRRRRLDMVGGPLVLLIMALGGDHQVVRGASKPEYRHRPIGRHLAAPNYCRAHMAVHDFWHQRKKFPRQRGRN